MIVPQKVRMMSKKEKFQYYLTRYMSGETGDNQKQEAITVISELMKGTPIDKIAEEFGVDCEYNLNVSPATITITNPQTEEKLTFDLNVPDRDQFYDAHPEATTRPIKSFLTDKEKEELTGTEK